MVNENSRKRDMINLPPIQVPKPPALQHLLCTVSVCPFRNGFCLCRHICVYFFQHRKGFLFVFFTVLRSSTQQQYWEHTELDWSWLGLDVAVSGEVISNMAPEKDSIAWPSGSQPEAALPTKGHLTMFRDIFGCPRWERGATGIWWIEAGDAAKHPTMHSMFLQNRKLPGAKCQ